MKIVIVGAGKVGLELCMALSEENHDICLIEKNQTRYNNIIESADITGIVGNGAFHSVQKEAHVDTCDIFISVTAQDEVNIIACILAKKLGAKSTFARVRTPEYVEFMRDMESSLGVNMMMNPDFEAALEIYRILQYPSALSVEPFAHGKINLVELPVEGGSVLDGINMIQFRQKFPDLIVCVIQKNNTFSIPEGRTVLSKDDRCFITGKHEDLNKLYKELGTLDKIRSVLIVGGGRLSNYLLELLKNSKKQIKVIEQNESAATKIASKYSNVSVILGDGTDQTLLSHEHISKYDCLVALTGIDEENIILSMFANTVGVPRTITKINRLSLIPIIGSFGIQSVITPAKIGATAILRYIRSIDSAADRSQIESLFRLNDGSVEIMEFLVKSTFKDTDVPLKDISFLPGVLIALIVHEGKLVFPTGNDKISVGDRIIAVAKDCHPQILNDLLRS